jgi:hypothetical protein
MRRGAAGQRLVMPGMVVAGLLLLAGCAGGTPGGGIACGPGLTPSVGLTGMFGLTRPSGALLPQDAWREFLASELAPRFPAGFTVTEATGSWRNRQGEVISVPTRLFFVLAPADDAAAARVGLEAAIAAWLRRTGQESVGLLVQPGCTSGLF